MSSEKIVACQICPHYCKLKPNNRGLCGTIVNREKSITDISYGIIDMKIDFIENSGFHHFVPGHKALFLFFPGCNLKCIHCKYWIYAHRFPEDFTGFMHRRSPKEIINYAQTNRIDTIVFMRGEPLIHYKFVKEVAKLAKENNIYTGVVSNGFINSKILEEVIPYIDAFNIQLLGTDDRPYYRLTITPQAVNNIMGTIDIIFKTKKHLEISYFVVPGLSDNVKKFKEFCLSFIKKYGNKIPLVLRRFFPYYLAEKRAPARNKIILQFWKVAKASGFSFAYVFDLFLHKSKHTYCPEDNTVLIKRYGDRIAVMPDLKNKKCRKCGYEVPIFGTLRSSIDLSILKK